MTQETDEATSMDHNEWYAVSLRDTSTGNTSHFFLARWSSPWVYIYENDEIKRFSENRNEKDLTVSWNCGKQSIKVHISKIFLFEMEKLVYDSCNKSCEIQT